MLTISQLASYSGVSVRAVRHYHAIGLLPEPKRDHSGYRRYDAAAVVELIRIRTLAEAGVPLARVHELLRADDDALAAAVAEIDARLVAEIEGMAAGRALDVGAGEGADAVWLAEQGWAVTAVDIASLPLERGRAEAESRGPTVAERITASP